MKIALENMWGRDSRRGCIIPNVCSVPEELADYCDSLDSEWFTVCLDIGHISLVGEDEERFIKTLGAKRLTCLHVHDNNFCEDSHMPPFTMKLDWKKISSALRSIGYRGDLTLESDGLFYNMPPALIPAGLAFQHSAGRQLISLIENGDENS